jgi:hypothetical protein
MANNIEKVLEVAKEQTEFFKKYFMSRWSTPVPDLALFS